MPLPDNPQRTWPLEAWPVLDIEEDFQDVMRLDCGGHFAFFPLKNYLECLGSRDDRLT